MGGLDLCISVYSTITDYDAERHQSVASCAASPSRADSPWSKNTFGYLSNQISEYSLEPWGISHIEGDVAHDETEQDRHVYSRLFCVHDIGVAALLSNR